MKILALLLALAGLLLAGCGTMSNSRKIVEAQTPGTSSGAGATFTGPSNAAAPSSQIAQRRVGYYPAPVRDIPLPRYNASAAAPAQPVQDSPAVAPEHAPQPAWIDEKTETTFGQHQDAAGLVQAAVAVSSWGKARWIGILCVVFSALALAWAHNNPEGYPLIAWKIGAAGLFFIVLDPSLWWLLLLLIPAGLYVVQRLNLMRLP